MREIIDLTKDLIRFQSIHSMPREIKRCFEFIENDLHKDGIACRWIDHSKFPSLLVVPSNAFVPILLMSHIDVVDAPNNLFNPLEKDHKLYGRGSFDDKYAVALSLVLLKKYWQQLQKQGKNQDDLPFGIVITSDEEIGGFNGAKKVLQQIKTDFCIVLDGGSIEKMVVKEKGLVRLKLVSDVEVDVRPQLWPGENAVEKLIDDFIAIRNCCVRSLPKHRHRAVNISSIQTGKAHNQVPKYAEAVVDIRYTKNDRMDARIEYLKKELHSQVMVESVEPVLDEGPTSYLNLLLEIADKTSIGFEDSTNDARFLSECGTTGIIWGADGDRSQHTLEEHVNIESVYELYYILDKFLKRAQNLNQNSERMIM